MTHTPSHPVLRVLVIGTVAALAGACAGGGPTPRPSAAAPTAPAAPSTAPPAPAPRSAASVAPAAPAARPAPDPVAEFHRLDAALHDLFEHPDPERLDRFVVPGTRTYDEVHRDLDRLRRVGLGYAEPGSQIIDVRVATETPELVYLRVTYRDTVRLLVEADGTVREEQPADPQSAWVVVLQPYREGYRIAATSRAIGDVEVQL